MSRQLKPNEWIELFKIYETSNLQNVWIKYADYKEKITNSIKNSFKLKYKKFIKSNRDMNTLISMTGKKSTNKRKIGRPKNTQDKHEIWKEFLQEIGYDELSNLISELVDNGDEKLIDKLKEITKKSKLSSRKMSSILNLSKSTICNIRNNKPKIIRDDSKRKLLINRIHDIFIEHNSNIGRKRIAGILFKKFEYKISDRQVGNIMNENNWFCNIRKSRKRKENKNLNANINDLVLRDFDNKQHEEEILATDVTYIPSTYDCLQNNVYLSVVISHITKEIIGWKLSMNNDVKLIIDSFDSIKNKTKNVIVHSDHGACYTSSVFTEMLKKHHWTQSMSRVGNALDNRVVEFWFSILKTELIYNLNTKKISFKELENEIANFINYYNNVRIQEKLNWMTPIEYKNHLQLNI